MGKKTKVKEEDTKTVPCFKCGKAVDADDYHCFGCNAHVCDDCNVTGVTGTHSPEDHLG